MLHRLAVACTNKDTYHTYIPYIHTIHTYIYIHTLSRTAQERRNKAEPPPESLDHGRHPIVRVRSRKPLRLVEPSVWVSGRLGSPQVLPSPAEWGRGEKKRRDYKATCRIRILKAPDLDAGLICGRLRTLLRKAFPRSCFVPAM